LGMGPTIAVLSMVEQLLMRPLAGATNSETAAYLQLLESESHDLFWRWRTPSTATSSRLSGSNPRKVE